jgi:uncharacterized protein (TIGR03118 family)
MLSLIRSLYRPQRAQRINRPRTYRPTCENLEDRRLLATTPVAFLQTNLVSDLPGVAKVLDPNLVNPWGIAESGGSAFWISDNNSGLSTLYNTAGTPQTLVVSIPTPGDPTGASGAPTGTVFNIDGGKTGGFVINNATPDAPATASASAVFLFATEDGTIVGWNPGVNPQGSDPTKAGTFGIIAVDNSGNNFTEPDPALQTGAVYKGLAIATDPTTHQTLLYAANFRSGQVDVFGADFMPAKLPDGAFTDPNLPKGYAPFNVQALGGKIYVTYAKQNADKHDDVEGPGHGFVDVFNLDGTPGLAGGKERLISRGALNSPWGLVIAPPSFGKLAGSLLVGNFGDGLIHAYNATTGASLGTLKDPDGEPIQIDGLWALKVGNGGNGGDTNTVYFTAGLDHERHGLFGSLSAVAPGSDEGQAEEQVVQAALDVFFLDLNQLFKDIGNGADATTIAQDIQTVRADRIDLIQKEIRLAVDEIFDGLQSGHSSGSNTGGFLGLLGGLFGDFGGL